MGRRVWMWAAVALAVVLLAYANAWDNAFHFDDFHTVTDNPAVRSLGNVPKFFEDATLFSVQPSNRTYRPVVSASLALDYALGHGYEPFWFHLSTMVWFCVLLGCIGAMFFRAMQWMRPGEEDRNALWAVGGAAWFGLHPAMAETVNYVIQRGDLYCTLGCVAGIVVWAVRPGWRRFGLYLLPVVLALLSKPPAAVFPVLLGMWVWLFETEPGMPGRWAKTLRAVAPSVAMVAVVMLVESHMTPKSYLPSIVPVWDYRMTQPLVWLRYFGELFLPLHLNVDTDLTAAESVTPAVAAGLAFLVALVGAIVYTVRRRAWYPVAFGLLWFVVTQLPTSLYALSEVENDHRMFFSFAGLMLAVIWAVRMSVERVAVSRSVRTALVACGFVALAGYAWGTHVRNEVWHTEESLWKDDVEKSPHNGRGLMNYGLILMGRGDYTGAKMEFEDALQYTPNYATLEVNLGVVNGAMGNGPEAERHFVRALSLSPSDDTTHSFYGRWLLDQGRVAEAVAQEREAVALNPARPMQQGLLAEALARGGQPAVPAASAANAAPQTAAAWIDRSLALNQAGKYDDSIAAAREALKLDPSSPFAWNNIAAGYEAEKKWDPAIAAAKKAIALKPDFQLAKNNLAWSEQQKKLGAK